MIEKEDYKNRIRQEHDDLKLKMDKLVLFIYGDKFEKLDLVRQELLVEQLKAMEKYLSILVKRMEVENII